MEETFVKTKLEIKKIVSFGRCKDYKDQPSMGPIVNKKERPTDPPTHTHTRKQRKVKKNTLECKKNGYILNIPDHKNVNRSKNRLTPLKL